MVLEPRRAASSADADFIYRVVETTMRGYVEKTWGRFDEVVNRKSIAAMIARGEYESSGRPARMPVRCRWSVVRSSYGA
jgi:hypothetical protein